MQPEGWSRLVETFSPIVYAWCRKSGLSAADASDVVQDVFVAVARGIGDFQRKKSSGSFRSWLATITRHRIIDAIRKLEKFPDVRGGTEFLFKIQNQPEILDESITEASLNQAIPEQVMNLVRDEVEPRTWKAFWLATVEEKSTEEVSEELNMNVASVYQAKSRVLRRIRQRMAELP